MKTVGIAELKARLSEYLRGVRRGHSLTVVDRRTPIARIVPIRESESDLVVRLPEPDGPAPGRVPLPPPLSLEIDVVDLLLEERRNDR